MSLRHHVPMLVLSSSLVLAACGGGGGDDAQEIDPDGTHTRYVVDSLLVPGNSSDVESTSFDIDGDGTTENAAGGLLSALSSALGLDIQATVQTNIDNAAVVILADLQATDLVAASGVGMRVYQGADPDPAACTDPEDPSTCGQHLQGGASFSIAASSPDDAVIVGSNVGGRFTGGPGNVQLELPLASSAEPVVFDLIGARMEAGVSADALDAGKLGGAVSKEDIEEQVIPAVVGVLTALIGEDCTGAAPDCCADAESTGASILDFFDEDGDCAVTEAEIVGQSIVASTLLNPDLDLFDADGNFEPNSDGVKDSLSLGVGFTAVSATFTP